MSLTYAKRRRDAQLCKCAAMRAAKERNRLASVANAANWRQVGMFLCVLEAHSDGRHFGVRVIGRDDRRQVGTWRTCAATVAKVFRDAIQRRSNANRT